MIKASFKIDGVLKTFERMAKMSKDLRPVLMVIQGEPRSTNPNTIIGGIGQQFLTQGRYFGEEWSQLSTPYATWKAKAYPGRSILVQKGDLFNAVTTPGAKGNVRILEWTRLSWGVQSGADGIPYAAVHLKGSKKLGIPKREYMGVTTEQKKKWKALIAHYLASSEVGKL